MKHEFFFITGAILGFLTLAEILLAYTFWPFIYRMGIPVYKKTIDVKSTKLSLPSSRTIKKSEGVFHLNTNGKVYFLSRFRFLSFNRSKAFLHFRCIATLKPTNKIVVIVKIPLGMILFLCFWIKNYLWFSGINNGPHIPFSNLGPISFLGMIYLFIFIIALMNLLMEKARMDTMIRELREILKELIKEQEEYADSDARAEELKPRESRLNLL
ncbi:hypothetical protein AAG747_24405 [Rapidithrix thailandica]|uniref:Uncharacterized protein n=1 Tax=Rapidithrix thailandica TaxID=413964 RepID=A0AAW9SDH6_9BACT